MDLLPPHSIDAEQSVLGAMLIESTAIASAAKVLTAVDFYRSGHSCLFEAITHLAEQGKPADLVTVQEELNRRGKMEWVGGLPYLVSLFNAVPTAAHVEFYARIVQEKSLLRRLLSAGVQIEKLALSDLESAGDAVNAAEQVLFGVSRGQSAQSGLTAIRKTLLEVYDSAEERAESGGGLSGLPTGFPVLDEMLGGLQDTDLILVGARPSMGKSAAVLAMARHVALEAAKPVAFFSLEMSAAQIGLRLLCGEASLDSNAVKNGKLKEHEWNRLADANRRLYEMPLYVDDAREQTVLNLRMQCRRMQAGGGVSLIIVDYLQNMGGGKSENRNLQLDEVCRQLRALAQEMNVPLVLLSQLSRGVETRENKRPMLSDLRDSGAIEGHADTVLFLYRESYYKRGEMYEWNEDGTPVQDEVEIICAKNRNGPTGTVKVGFVKPYARFEPLATSGSTGF